MEVTALTPAFIDAAKMIDLAQDLFKWTDRNGDGELQEGEFDDMVWSVDAARARRAAARASPFLWSPAGQGRRRPRGPRH